MTSSIETVLSNLLALLLMATTCACVTTTIDTSCTSFAPITYSPSRDTIETVTQARQHNAAWIALCKK